MMQCCNNDNDNINQSIKELFGSKNTERKEVDNVEWKTNKLKEEVIVSLFHILIC